MAQAAAEPLLSSTVAETTQVSMSALGTQVPATALASAELEQTPFAVQAPFVPAQGRGGQPFAVSGHLASMEGIPVLESSPITPFRSSQATVSNLADDAATNTAVPVDVNLASVVQLQKILTDDLTNKVYQERLAHGNYKSWDDLLLRVKGLGKSKVKALNRANFTLPEGEKKPKPGNGRRMSAGAPYNVVQAPAGETATVPDTLKEWEAIVEKKTANIAQGKPPYLGIPDQFKEVLEQLDANENDGGIPSSDATARKPAGPGSARSASGTPPPAQPIRTPASSVYAAPRGRDSPPRSNGARPRHLPPHLSDDRGSSGRLHQRKHRHGMHSHHAHVSYDQAIPHQTHRRRRPSNAGMNKMHPYMLKRPSGRPPYGGRGDRFPGYPNQFIDADRGTGTRSDSPPPLVPLNAERKTQGWVLFS